MQLSDKFFTFDTGEKSHFFDIITSSGLSLSLLSIGASIQKIAFKDKKWSDHPETDGNELPITLSSGNPDFYRLCPCYAGATLAPNAGRISGSSILLGGETIPLTPNEGANQLHGGPHNLSAQNWNTEFVRQDYDSVSIGFSAFLADGVDGYPGNRTFHAEYTLDDSNWLTIRYRASTDRPTYINMSNHTYWNLSGDFSSSALDETLTVFANNVCLNNEEHIPVEIIPIARTIFDFSSPASLKSRLDFLPREEKLRSRCRRQISIARGYNHAFILSRDQTSRNFRSLPQPVRKACILFPDTPSRFTRMPRHSSSIPADFSMIPSDSRTARTPARHAPSRSKPRMFRIPHMFCRNIFPSQRRNIRLSGRSGSRSGKCRSNTYSSAAGSFFRIH